MPNNWTSDGTPANIQSIIGNPATLDGDTIIIPAGTFSWTTSVLLNGSKSLTLQGQTTLNTGVNPFTANDQTIILDNTPGACISASSSLKNVRVTGITIRKSTRGFIAGGAISLGGTQVRIDHCHISDLNRDHFIDGYNYQDCIDHNLLELTATAPQSNANSIHLVWPNWTPAGNTNNNGAGDGAWATYPYFGTDKFAFIEDNCFINGSGSPTGLALDADTGSRYVFRYNHVYDTTVQTHGTENRTRGNRALEIYNNDFNFTRFNQGNGGIRTGTGLIHDNTFTGFVPQGWAMNDLRFLTQFNSGINNLGGVSGNNSWDINDVTNGTVTPGQTLTTSVASPIAFVNGAFTYTGVNNGLYLSGTCTAGTGNTALVDSTKTWTTDQWKGFVLRKVSTGQISPIQSNTATTCTLVYFTGGSLQSPNWVSGDAYEIRRSLLTLDQPGRGKADLLVGGYNDGGAALNSTSGTVLWPHQASEPIYGWNNRYGGNVVNVVSVYPYGDPAARIMVEGRDYFNDGDGASAASAGVRYNTLVGGVPLNGVNYGGPFTYPHPLVSGVTPSAPAISSPLTASGTVGVAFSYQITGTNSPTSFGASSLPPGLTLNSVNGLISGTPTAAAIYNTTISATNASGTGSAVLVVNVQTQVITQFPPAISSPTTASGIQNTVFSYQIAATQNPTSYSATGLPAGLAVNSGTGLISGTPTAVAVTNITIGAANASGTGTAVLVLTITAAAPTPVGRHPKKWKNTLLRRRQR